VYSDLVVRWFGTTLQKASKIKLKEQKFYKTLGHRFDLAVRPFGTTLKKA